MPDMRAQQTQAQSEVPPLESSSSPYMHNIRMGVIGGIVGGGIGAVCGTCFGLIKNWSYPSKAGLVLGKQWAVLGSIYTFTRKSLTYEWEANHTTSALNVAISAIAGGIAGGLPASFKSRKAALRALPLCMVLGGSGQLVFELSRSIITPKKGHGWIDSKYSPLKRINDEDYLQMLENKLSAVDADLALLNDKIKAARARLKANEIDRSESNKS